MTASKAQPRHVAHAVHVARAPKDKAHRAAASRGGDIGSSPSLIQANASRKLRRYAVKPSLSRVCVQLAVAAVVTALCVPGCSSRLCSVPGFAGANSSIVNTSNSIQYHFLGGACTQPEATELGQLLALLKYPFYPLFILDNGMNLISKSLTVLTPA